MMGYFYNHGYYNQGYGMMGYGGGWIMMIGFLLLIVVGVIFLYKMFNNHNKPEDVSSTSAVMKILDERYAKGEISDEEYKNKKFNMR